MGARILCRTLRRTRHVNHKSAEVKYRPREHARDQERDALVGALGLANIYLARGRLMA